MAVLRLMVPGAEQEQALMGRDGTHYTAKALKYGHQLEDAGWLGGGRPVAAGRSPPGHQTSSGMDPP